MSRTTRGPEQPSGDDNPPLFSLLLIYDSLYHPTRCHGSLCYENNMNSDRIFPRFVWCVITFLNGPRFALFDSGIYLLLLNRGEIFVIYGRIRAAHCIVPHERFIFAGSLSRFRNSKSTIVAHTTDTTKWINFCFVRPNIRQVKWNFLLWLINDFKCH